MLLNLVSAANASNKDVLWGFIRREAPDASPRTDPLLDHLVGYALKYYADFVKPIRNIVHRTRRSALHWKTGGPS